MPELPPKQEFTENEQLSTVKPTKAPFRVEKWLKIGGIVYIFIALPSAISNIVISMDFPPFNKQDSGMGMIIIHLVNFLSSFLSSVMWGAAFFGLGRIIEILQEAFGNEKI